MSDIDCTHRVLELHVDDHLGSLVQGVHRLVLFDLLVCQHGTFTCVKNDH